MNPEMIGRLDEINKLLMQYVPAGFHLDKAKETIRHLPLHVEDLLRRGGQKCRCGETLVCPDCDIEVVCDPEIIVHGKKYFPNKTNW